MDSHTCEVFYGGSTPGTARRLEADREFQDWMKRNPTGYIFNHFGGRNSNENLLHQLPGESSCLEAMNTGARKICCMDRACIERTVRELRGEDGWQLCGDGCCSR